MKTRRSTRSPGVSPKITPRIYSMMAQGPRVLPNIVGSDPLKICAWEPWMQHSACLDVDPELFYPERGDNNSPAHARRICAGCPVKRDCLEYAVAHHEPFGIWGGLSPRERREAARS